MQILREFPECTAIAQAYADAGQYDESGTASAQRAMRERVLDRVVTELEHNRFLREVGDNLAHTLKK